MANTNSNQVKLLVTLTVTPIQETAPATHSSTPGQGLVNPQPNAVDAGSIPVQVPPAQFTAPDQCLPNAESESAEIGFDMNELLYHEEDNVQQPSDKDWQMEFHRFHEELAPFVRAYEGRTGANGIVRKRPIHGDALIHLEMVCHVEHMMMCMLSQYSLRRRDLASCRPWPAYPSSRHSDGGMRILQRFPRLYAMFLHLQSTCLAQTVARYPDSKSSKLEFFDLTKEMFYHSYRVNILIPPSTYSQEFPKTYAFSLRHPATEKDEARARPGDYREGITFPLTPITHILTAVRTVFAMLHEYCDKRGIQHKWTLELGPGRAPDGDDSGDEGDSRRRKRARIE